MEHYLVINDWALESIGEQEINVLCGEDGYYNSNHTRLYILICR